MVERADAICVHEGSSLTIKLRFADAFEQAAGYTETNHACLAAASEV